VVVIFFPGPHMLYVTSFTGATKAYMCSTCCPGELVLVLLYDKTSKSATLSGCKLKNLLKWYNFLLMSNSSLVGSCLHMKVKKVKKETLKKLLSCKITGTVSNI